LRAETDVKQSLRVAIAVIVVLVCGLTRPASTDVPAAHNVVLITLDGVRTQEIFGGLDKAILRSTMPDARVEETETWRRYAAGSPAQRRQKLLPFFWTTLMTEHGSIAGNRALGSTSRLSNTHWFSYPGYAEILTGAAHDKEIASNDNVRIPFTTVLEFTRDKLQLPPTGVATFGSWETFRWIAEHQEGATTVNAGMHAYDLVDREDVRALSDFQFRTRPPWSGARFDAYTMRFARAHLERYRPRMLYVALDDTDDWAHSGRYDRVLDAINAFDAWLRDLWTWLQNDPDYRDRTLLVITTDHGRGDTAADWRSHGSKVAGSEFVWIAFAGTTPMRGEWRNAPETRQSQIAATMAEALGLDYAAAVPEAGKPIDLTR
jgi:hypothetical protein